MKFILTMVLIRSCGNIIIIIIIAININITITTTLATIIASINIIKII